MNTEDNLLAMSDDAFMESGGADAIADAPQETSEDVDQTQEESAEAEEQTTDESTAETNEFEEGETYDEEYDDAEASDESVDSEDTGDTDTDDFDYKAAYEQLTKPFKANGKEIKVESVDDAVSLMQMGANYNKKMAALKPNLKMLKMLENNGLLDESKLSFLIDLDKKDPSAIKKLVKDSEVDAYDLTTDVDGEDEYQPKDYRVNDTTMDLEAVLEDIKSTPAYSETMDILSNQWDDASRDKLVKVPQSIKVINEHVQNGIYATIAEEVDRQKMLGKLNGVSDIDAYSLVGDELYAQGKLGTPAQSTGQPTQPTQATKPSNTSVTKRKKAAATTKSTAKASSQANNDYNPLAMSDEEFEKTMAKYL